MKDVSTNVTIDTVDVSTNVTIETVDVSTSLIEISDVSASPIDTSDASPIETQNESASSSVVHVESNIQGEKKTVCKTLLFGETVRKLPYQEKREIIMFNRNMKEPKFSLDMVSLNNAAKKGAGGVLPETLPQFSGALMKLRGHSNILHTNWRGLDISVRSFILMYGKRCAEGGRGRRIQLFGVPTI